MTAYLLERAVLGDAVADDVLVRVEGGRLTAVEPGGHDPAATRLAGLTLPGLADCHSHAFHRALRGHVQARGDFWSWREQMYALAARLTPDSYFALARAAYREMAAAGITTVGEFHYLHHQPDGTAYADPNAMGHALVAAAREAGVRIALLDACYLSAGDGRPVEGVQVRYTDGTAAAWAERVAALAEGMAGADDARVGAAIHSVRAVPADQLDTVVEAARGRPLHVHLSEQPAENDECLAAYGVTPTRLLDDHGALGALTTAVHATHLTDDDVDRLGRSGTGICLCPTTERDLGDGIGPARRLQDAGAALTLGSDSHAVVDPFEEMRALEMDERLATRRRGHWRAAELLRAGTGHASLGFPDAGTIAVGQRADLVTLDVTTPRTAGTGAGLETAVFAATAGDVRHVVAGGRVVFRPGDEQGIGAELAEVIGRIRA